MDISIYLQAAVNGVPILFVVFVLVQIFKNLKSANGEPLLQHNAILIAALAVGLLFGSGYAIAATRPPQGDWWTVYVYWFGVIVYGLGLGGAASVFWDALKAIIERAIERMIDKGGGSP